MVKKNPEERPNKAQHEAAEPAECVYNPGLPDEDTIVEEKSFTSPKGRHYRILRTTQTDPYDDTGGVSDQVK